MNFIFKELRTYFMWKILKEFHGPEYYSDSYLNYRKESRKLNES